jgi:hypothetical protein
MSHPYPDPSRPRGRFRQWLSRVWAAIRNRKTIEEPWNPVPGPDHRITVNHTSDLSFDTPARGDAYDFTVSVALCWCAAGTLSEQALRDKLTSRVPEMNAEITAAARPVARHFAPYRPDLAEEHVAKAVHTAVQSVLAATPDTDGVVLTCTARTRVAPAPAISEMQRQHVAPEMELEARYALSRLAAERLGELRVTWRDFIADGLPEWTTPYATSLALHWDETPKILFGMRADRQHEAEGMVNTIAQVASGHDRLDLLEFAVASDSALRKTYELLGIPLPDQAPDSLFSAPSPAMDGDEPQ